MLITWEHTSLGFTPSLRWVPSSGYTQVLLGACKLRVKPEQKLSLVLKSKLGVGVNSELSSENMPRWFIFRPWKKIILALISARIKFWGSNKKNPWGDFIEKNTMLHCSTSKCCKCMRTWFHKTHHLKLPFNQPQPLISHRGRSKSCPGWKTKTKQKLHGFCNFSWWETHLFPGLKLPDTPGT